MADIANLPERLRSKIEVLPNGCWQWQGYVNWAGYGVAWIGSLPTSAPGGYTGAHKIVYEALAKLVGDGMQLDHVCHDPAICKLTTDCPHRRCCNPGHLIEKTGQANTRRSNSLAAANAGVTHCPRGHPYDGTNTYVSEGERHCRQCRRDRRAERTPEQAAAVRAKDRARQARRRELMKKVS
jgi:hypothetical protein